MKGLIRSHAAFKALIGPFIGAGSSRNVYAHSSSADHIIKVSIKPPHTSNRTEWFIWNEIENERSVAATLGRCEAMSTSGLFLIMERLDDLTTPEELARRRYPDWTTDHKTNAFGVNAKGEVKVRDYGMVTLGQTLASATIHDLPTDEDMGKWLKLFS